MNKPCLIAAAVCTGFLSAGCLSTYVVQEIRVHNHTGQPIRFTCGPEINTTAERVKVNIDDGNAKRIALDGVIVITTTAGQTWRYPSFDLGNCVKLMVKEDRFLARGRWILPVVVMPNGWIYAEEKQPVSTASPIEKQPPGFPLKPQ
jgi:hypothetical protein